MNSNAAADLRRAAAIGSPVAPSHGRSNVPMPNMSEPVPVERVPQADADAEVVRHPLAEDEPVGLVDRVGQRVGRADAAKADAAGNVREELVCHRVSFLECARVRRQVLSSASSWLGDLARPLSEDDHAEDLVGRDLRLVDCPDDPAVVHDADPVGQIVDVVDVVADQEDPDALGLELADEVADLRRLRRPEGSRGLVHDQDLRVEVDGARDRHRLALAAGQRIGPAARSG